MSKLILSDTQLPRNDNENVKILQRLKISKLFFFNLSKNKGKKERC